MCVKRCVCKGEDGEKKRDARERVRGVLFSFLPSHTLPLSHAVRLPSPFLVWCTIGMGQTMCCEATEKCCVRKEKHKKERAFQQKEGEKKTQSVPLLFAVVEKGVCLCVCNSSQVSGSGVHETTQDTAACPLGLCLCRGVCFCRSPLHSLVRDNKGDEGFTQSLCPAIANF